MHLFFTPVGKTWEYLDKKERKLFLGDWFRTFENSKSLNNTNYEVFDHFWKIGSPS